MLGPGIGGFELVVIALVALIVVGPKDLPMLMRKVGQFVGRARKMASEFRASFDDMARQSELDDLRKEVEALRSGPMSAVQKDTTQAFKDLDKDLRQSPVMKSVVNTPPMTEPGAPEAAFHKAVADKPDRTTAVAAKPTVSKSVAKSTAPKAVSPKSARAVTPEPAPAPAPKPRRPRKSEASE